MASETVNSAFSNISCDLSDMVGSIQYTLMDKSCRCSDCVSKFRLHGLAMKVCRENDVRQEVGVDHDPEGLVEITI